LTVGAAVKLLERTRSLKVSLQIRRVQNLPLNGLITPDPLYA